MKDDRYALLESVWMNWVDGNQTDAAKEAVEEGVTLMEMRAYLEYDNGMSLHEARQLIWLGDFMIREVGDE